MSIIRSFFICVSMYSIIPVPNIAWQEKDMKYIFYMLVFLGILLGLGEYGIYVTAEHFHISSVLYFQTGIVNHTLKPPSTGDALMRHPRRPENSSCSRTICLQTKYSVPENTPPFSPIHIRALSG